MNGLVEGIMDACCRRTSRVTFSPENSSFHDVLVDGDMVVICFTLLDLIRDELGPLAVLSADCSKDFDEFIARSDSFRDDCAKGDWDHGGECSNSNFFGCFIPTGATK